MHSTEPLMIGALAQLTTSAAPTAPTERWRYSALSIRGRDIVNNRNETTTWVGANWPGRGETVILEGLEWSSAEEIISKVAGVRFNFVRLTYSVEMLPRYP